MTVRWQEVTCKEDGHKPDRPKLLKNGDRVIICKVCKAELIRYHARGT